MVGRCRPRFARESAWDPAPDEGLLGSKPPSPPEAVEAQTVRHKDWLRERMCALTMRYYTLRYICLHVLIYTETTHAERVFG